MATRESPRQTQLRWPEPLAMPSRAAREVLQSTLQRVNVPCFISDANGQILWLNDAANAAFGDRAGHLYTDIVVPEHTGRVAAEIDRMRNGATHSDYEIDAILRDGRHRRVEISAVPIEGNAVFHGVFGVVLRPGAQPSAAAASPLTPRQQEVLELLASGRSTRDIAASLHLSRETVRNHVRDLLRALGAHSRIEALAEARRRGLTE
jgi:PAS domain S-box-containing protein